MSLSRSLLSFVLCIAGLRCSFGDDFRFFHENVLGTSLELRVRADQANQANQIEATVLSELDRLQQIFSTHDSSSELSRFVALPVGQSMKLSAELTAALADCEHWNQASQGVFQPAIQTLSHTWQQHAAAGQLPTFETLHTSIGQMQQTHWRIDPQSGETTRCSDVPLTLNGIAEGEILDQVIKRVYAEHPQTVGIVINIGGDIRVAGELDCDVAIADPSRDQLNANHLHSISVRNASVSTSGHTERSLQIGNQRYSHIIDPRSGMPVQEIVSSTIIAPTASTADALSTICSVLSAKESLALVSSIPGVRCMLVTASGAVLTSPNWPAQDGSTPVAAPEQSKAPMIVEFEIKRAENAGRYRRPYVAVWIEDKEGFPVKTLSLFLMQNQPGPRWYRDLRRWYSDEQLRKVVDDTDLIATVSKPTRNPGKYRLEWDGKDDSGKALPAGDYTLLIEAAREHGTYQLMKHPFKVGGEAFDTKLPGNDEIAEATIKYSPEN